jgi:translation initiation factor 2B subunit (eIF-2B alpha/beta/delta family)
MIMRQAKTTLLKPPRRELGVSDHDPAQLSASLRELALRAFQLVRTRDGSTSEFERGAESCEKELKDVHEQIVQLQRALRAQHMNDLAVYVTALRERVEECLD